MSRDHTVALSLTAKDAGKALDFYVRAFGAEVVERFDTPGGKLPHAEFRIGNTCVYLSDESAEWHAAALPSGMMAPCLFALRVPDVEAAYARALEVGAKSLAGATEETSPIVLDPFGYRWTFHQRSSP